MENELREELRDKEREMVVLQSEMKEKNGGFEVLNLISGKLAFCSNATIEIHGNPADGGRSQECTCAIGVPSKLNGDGDLYVPQSIS